MVKKILSGMRPTGRLHIGHLVGALDNWVDLQDRYDSYFFVADFHALTTERDTAAIRKSTVEMAKDWLTYGVKPDRVTLFIQSQVPEHAELHLILSMLPTMARIERLPTFKGRQYQVLDIQETGVDLTPDQVEEAKGKITYGFTGYPVLMAADILIHKADGVPVGDDQDSHLELTKELARTFNHTYGVVFPEPAALYTPSPRILGTDGRKMSKSFGNVIAPTDSPEDILRAVKKMRIDPARQSVSIPGEPERCSVYDLHKAFTPAAEMNDIASRCRSANIGCGDCKGIAAQSIVTRFRDYRERRAYWDGKEAEIIDILMEGSRKARKVASATMAQVKDAMRLSYI